MDYTSLANVKAWGNIQTATDDTLLSALISACSAKVDNYCGQVFGQATYTNDTLRAQVDEEGLLTCWPSVPVISALTSASWKLMADTAWTSIDLSSSSAYDIVQSNSGCTVRFISPELFMPYRPYRMRVRATYTAGWANLAAVPADFEIVVRRLVHWTYKQRDSVQGKTAMPSLGVVIIPQDWPADVKRDLVPFKWTGR
jgi:hypothetical protein